MPAVNAADADALAERAARLLGVRFAGVERLSDEESPKLVLRCAVEGGSVGVVLKQDSRRRAGDADAIRRFANEWAGPVLLDALAADPPLSPRCLGGDVAAGFVALEDLAPTGSLVEPLTGDDAAAAEAALLAYADLLGRLHGATAGRIDQYQTIRAGVEPGGDPRSGHGRDVVRLAARVPGFLAEFGVAPEPGFAAELGSALARLAEPGPLLAYQHADSCPDNVAMTARGPRLIDFEHSGFGHALLDAAVVEMAFPTCWCANRVPDRVIERAAAAYRRALVPGCPAAADDRLFDEGYTAACVFWAFRTALFDEPAKFLADDREWGIATVRQRNVYWADRLAGVAGARGQLPAVAATAARLAAALRDRWGPGFVELPLYPAFRRPLVG
jgi:hypothetical protein